MDERRAGSAEDEGMVALDATEARIMLNFRQLVLSLQLSPDGQFGGSASKGALMKNEELVLVCAFLGGLQDFLRSLRLLQKKSIQLKDFHQVRRFLRP